MTEIKFSPSQKEIVERTQGAMAVIAAAGSGKTRVLTGRIGYLLEHVPGAYKILALTFTNKAADEMKDRLASIPGIANRVFIGTIHSFCLNLIREKGNVIGYNELPHIFEKETDRIELVTEVLKRNESLTHYNNLWNDRNKQMLYGALEYISTRKRNLQIRDIEDDIASQILYDDYNRLLAEQNAIDYDDIIILAYRILTEKPKIAELYRKIYQYICVDEAQDLNFAQYQFIKILCGEDHTNVLMVGDDKQAIFGFNGSDKKYFSEIFVSEFHAEKRYLRENYRSSKSIIRIANVIYPDSINETSAFYEGLFDYYAAKDEIDEAHYVLHMIKYYLNNATEKERSQIEEAITLDRICVIARNKFIFKALESELKSEKIAYFYKKGSETTLFESDEMRIFEFGVRIILNPRDNLHLRQLHSLLNDNKISGYNFDNTKEHLERLNPIYELIIRSWKCVEHDKKNLGDALDIIQHGIKSIENKDNINTLELIYDETELAKERWKKYGLSVSADSISIQGFFSNIALGMANIKNRKETGLTLGTVHSVKGLEYDIVFVIGLNEGTFPDYRAVKTGGKQIEEEKNLTYVALTRAKRFLHISYPQKKFMPWNKDRQYTQHPSRFLKTVFDEVSESVRRYGT